MSRRKKPSKYRPTKADRLLYESIIDLYLKDCYRDRSVARVSEIAEWLERNRPTLSRKCVAIFGHPLGRVLRERQLTYAAKLLRTSPLPIDEVAAEAGFGHRTSFYRQFKKRFGCTPNEYREKQPNATRQTQRRRLSYALSMLTSL